MPSGRTSQVAPFHESCTLAGDESNTAPHETFRPGGLLLLSAKRSRRLPDSWWSPFANISIHIKLNLVYRV